MRASDIDVTKERAWVTTTIIILMGVPMAGCGTYYLFAVMNFIVWPPLKYQYGLFPIPMFSKIGGRLG